MCVSGDSFLGSVLNVHIYILLSNEQNLKKHQFFEDILSFFVWKQVRMEKSHHQNTRAT